jgi:multimeric flavodoxin WrbA
MTAHAIAFGVQPGMREHGWDHEDRPVWPKVEAVDILVIGTPIWLGEQSSICRFLIERLNAMSGLLNDKGQSIFYGKTGGLVVTGNEDGIKHVAMNVLCCLSQLGYAQGGRHFLPTASLRDAKWHVQGHGVGDRRGACHAA